MEDNIKEENNINLENKKQIKVKKVGRLTFGITLILLGISVFIQSIVSLEILRYVLMMWPLIFISLGIEVIYYSKKEQIDLKYDVWGIILIFIILTSVTIFSAINYGVNKLLYNDNINEIISQELEDNTRMYNLSGQVTLVNLNDKKIDVKIIEDENFNSTKVTIRGKFNETSYSNKNIMSLLNGNYSIGSIIDLDKFNEPEELEEYEDVKQTNKTEINLDRKNFVTINKYPNWIDSVEIDIITNSKNKINTKGNFNLI